jgi:Zn-dependent M16 (insulinase) family peptidase
MEKFGFVLVKESIIAEYNAQAYLFKHQKSGARLLSITNDDENKVFGITFRTPPPDSTGLPHIMEHSALCGSRKYPVKEPFVELDKGSLNTFLNAMTYPDKTVYPIASQNIQDFWNLVDVYMDAVLFPLNSPETLQQEGWHYELNDASGELEYKGIVYNEMKGAYSSPDALLAKHSQQALFPDHVYGMDSGGNPEVIPSLTYDQFKQFHAKYYHPANAFIFFYGDGDLEEQLRRMDEYLREFDAITVESQIGMQAAFEAPRSFTFGYDPGNEGSPAKKAMLAVNWVLEESCDPGMTLSFSVLSHILVGTPASPLRKALIDSGLGEDLAGDGLEPDLRQMVFSTGLKGIAEEDSSRVETLIFQTLQDLVKNGIEPDMVAAAMNTIEFNLRENNTGSFPRGLSLMLRVLRTWLHEGDPIKPLTFEVTLDALKNEFESNPRYFEGLIKKYLLENSHRATILLRPEPGLNLKTEQAEQEKLAAIKSNLDSEALKKIRENAEKLKQRQETPDLPEALATIPSLKLSDIEKKNKTIPLEVTQHHGKITLFHDLFTNGILYLDLGFDLHQLPQEYLPLVSLFGRALLETGTEKEDFVRLSQRIGKTTGGIRPVVFTSSVINRSEAACWLFLRGKSTIAQRLDLLSVLKDILLSARLDNRDRFRQMVLEEKADQEAGMVPGGHRIINTRLRSKYNEAGWALEQIGGINYLHYLRDLVNEIDENWAGVSEKLEAMRRILINQQAMVINITTDRESWQVFKSELYEFANSLPGGSSPNQSWKISPRLDNEGLSIPAQVNYVGKGVNLYQQGYVYHGSLNVITNYLRATHLWERVRIQGGAYGVFNVFDPRSGVFTFLSYRDPNLIKTVENFDDTADFLKNLDRSRLSESELTKSIIGAIGEMDAYQLPDAKGYTSLLRYLLGESDEYRQKIRDEVLGTTLDNFQDFGNVLDKMKSSGSVVILGSEEALKEANQTHQNWLVIERVL